MAFLNKADSLRLAKELGIDNAEELSWKDLQAVLAAKQKELDDKLPDEPKISLEVIEEEKPQTRRVQLPYPDPMSAYYGKPVMIAPELPPERYRLLKYDEDLGNEIEVEEREFDMDPDTNRVFDKSGGNIDFEKRAGSESTKAYMDYTTGTYRIKGKNERRVTAMSSVPKENYGLGVTAGVDLFPIVTWNGRNGYLWTHPSYPNVKAALMSCGYYHEYKDQFEREPNIWYVAGKTLACDIGLVHHIFSEIEKKEQKKIEENNAYRRSIGL